MADWGGVNFPHSAACRLRPAGPSYLRSQYLRKPRRVQGHLEVEESTERNLPEGPEEWTDLGLVLYTN